MDQYSRAFFEMSLKLAFLTKKGAEYQDFFSTIMEKRHPADFMRVRPWGKVGDKKNDGYLGSRRMLFQCYAPSEMSASECVAKIKEDFQGALPHWQKHFDTWVFVHNSRDGLPPHVVEELLALRETHQPLNIIHWGPEDLLGEALQLSEASLASLLGTPPSQASMVKLSVVDLEPILDQIALQPPATDPDLRPVPATKLQHNLLSDHVGILLKAGMSRADVVSRYFRMQSDRLRRDRLAESFRSRYQALREQCIAPDDVFAELQRFAGGGQPASAARQCATLAVLAFFFEECDIFERPPDDDEPSSRSGGAAQ